MYDEYGGCPSGGVVAGITYIREKQCIIVANDATVKAESMVSHYKEKFKTTRDCNGK